MLRLIVGLGNSGQQYFNHRHNYGFLWLDALAQAHGVRWQERFGGAMTQWEFNAKGTMHKVYGLKPLEMMNCSGGAVGRLARYHDIAAKEILVAHDELAFPVGKVRLKLGGGTNGHNGVKDIMRHIGADFHRLRFGIDHPGDQSQVHGHVLSNFRPEERRIVDAVIDDTCRCADLLVCTRFADFMNFLAPHSPAGKPS